MSALPDYPAALETALRVVSPIPDDQVVPLDAADGRVLREPVVADRDLPPFDRAQMDGYAVRAADVGSVEAFPVRGRVAAGQAPAGSVEPGACIAIATGAPMPRGADAVIQHELSDRADPVHFTVTSITAGNAVHPRGADARRGQELVAPGTLLGPQHLGIAASVGVTSLRVARRPRAVVLTSGDEVRPAGAPVADHQIRNSNAPMAMALIARLGAEPAGHVHVADERDATIDAVGRALDEADLVITVGGVSAGERDWFPEAFAARGVEVALRGASIQPGKPILVGARGSTVVVALPGNPVSCLACSCLFVWPIVRCVLGLDADLPWSERTLETAVKPNPRRRAFRPAILAGTGGVRVPSWAGSGDLAHTAPTGGLVELPVQDEPVAAGTRLRFLGWP